MGRRRDGQAMTALGAMEERLVVAEPVIAWVPCRDDGAARAVLVACTVSRLRAGEYTTADYRMRASLLGAHCRGRDRPRGRLGLAGATGRQDPAGSSAVSGAQGSMGAVAAPVATDANGHSTRPPVIRGASR